MRATKKWLVPAAMLTTTGLLLAGCGSKVTTNQDSTTDNGTKNASASAPTDGGTLVVSTFSDIVTANPLYIEDQSSGDIQQLVFANMYDVNRQGEIVAEPWSLADGPLQISADGLTYTMKLKPNAKWSDGQPVTADDVVWTVKTIMNPDSGSALLSYFDHVKDVEKVDDHTVRFHLKSVYAPFQYSLNTPILPEHVLKDVPIKELQKNPYGTDPAKTVTDGPWKWTEWSQKKYLKFEANPGYWGPKPHIQSIVYKIYADQNTEAQALIKGDTDLLEAVPIPQLAAVKARSNLDVILKAGPQYEYLGFNFDSKNFPDNYDFFTSQKVRQAIAYALDKQGMVDSILHGTGALLNSPFLPAPVGWTGAANSGITYNYDPEKAKALLKEDGWTPGSDGILSKDGHRFSFDLLYNTGNSRRQQVAAVIQQELKQIGIDVHPKAMDFSALVDKNLNPGKFEAVLMGQGMNVDPDVSVLFDSQYVPPNGENMFWYKNPQVDKLLEQGVATMDKQQRSKIYQQAAEVMSQDLPQVFLYQYGIPFAYSSNIHWPSDWAPEPSLNYGYFYGILNWWSDRK